MLVTAGVVEARQQFVLEIDQVLRTDPTDQRLQDRFDRVQKERSVATSADEIQRLDRQLKQLQDALDRTRGFVLQGFHHMASDTGGFGNEKFAMWIIWPNERVMMRTAESLAAGDYVAVEGKHILAAGSRGAIVMYETSRLKQIERPNGLITPKAEWQPYLDTSPTAAELSTMQAKHPMSVVLTDTSSQYKYTFESNIQNVDKEGEVWFEINVKLDSGRTLPAIPARVKLLSNKGGDVSFVVITHFSLQLETDATSARVLRIVN